MTEHFPSWNWSIYYLFMYLSFNYNSHIIPFRNAFCVYSYYWIIGPMLGSTGLLIGTIHGHGACLSWHNLIHTNTTPIDASFIMCSGIQSLFRCNDCHVAINSLCLRWHNISHSQCNILCHILPEMLTMSMYCMVLCCLLTCKSI